MKIKLFGWILEVQKLSDRWPIGWAWKIMLCKEGFVPGVHYKYGPEEGKWLVDAIRESRVQR